ncbi:MAG: type IV pili twitching motility protein PilT, partial [Candidatus Omnitrophica bacterium]|nr:type IV pili twitching motility protein PilT [Candidatus Omnitrophota bacterium]
EVLVMSSAMKRLVKEGGWSQIPSIIETGKNVGMQSMEESIMKYYRDGLIDGEYIKEYMK